jgi:hypothetical protein
MKDFLADGMKLISAEQLEERLGICRSCDQYQENWCRQCGCQLALKARGRAFRCPLNKWPEVTDES